MKGTRVNPTTLSPMEMNNMSSIQLLPETG